MDEKKIAPKMCFVYHPDGRSVCVNTVDARKLMQGDWTDSPATAKEIAESLAEEKSKPEPVNPASGKTVTNKNAKK